MKRSLFVACCVILFCRASFGQVAVVTFTGHTPAEAVAIGSTYVGMEAFQLQGGNGRSSILYSDPFPITTWGHVQQPWDEAVPNTWENRSGTMQVIMRRDFPADWFDIVPRSDGTITLHQWHILEGSHGSDSNYAHYYPWYITGLDWLKGLRIKRDKFFMYKWNYAPPPQYQIYYGSYVDNVPESSVLAMLIPMVLVARRRKPS
jgi:hypothetical protein